MPFLSFAYLINALDRFNISMAALTMNKVAWPLGHRLRALVLFQVPVHRARRDRELSAPDARDWRDRVARGAARAIAVRQVALT